MKNRLISGALVLVSWLGCAQLQAQSTLQTWYFYQSGWTGGGTVSGSFTAGDLNGDGIISSFDDEVSNFSVSMAGNSIVPTGYTWSQANLAGLLYILNSGALLGDTAGEGLAVNDSSFNYASGLRPVNSLGGFLSSGTYSSGLGTVYTATTTPIMVSTSPITEQIYQAVLAGAPVPEPGSLALAISGGFGLLLLRTWRIQRKK